MTAYSVEQARRALPALDLAVRAPVRGVLADYCSLYGLDRLSAGGVQHHFGHVEAFGYNICTHVFLPPRPPRGTLLVLHGYFDHVGLFTHAIRRGLQRGYAVVAYDLPGHGLSSGAVCDIEDFSHYQEVLRDVLVQLKPQLPGPWVAVGQSTGGAILFDHVLSSLQAGKRPQFQRLQLWAPLVRIAQWRKVKLSYQLAGRFRRSVPRHFRRSSSDEAFIDLVWHRDPLQARELPLRWVGSAIRWEARMQAMPGCRFPLTLVQGLEDETVDWRYNVEFVREHCFLERLIEVPGASHHLANEREDLREQVMAALDRHVLL
ncbi:MAG: alpha/beta hydrolase [Perlucidibaca sp.]